MNKVQLWLPFGIVLLKREYFNYLTVTWRIIAEMFTFICFNIPHIVTSHVRHFIISLITFSDNYSNVHIYNIALGLGWLLWDKEYTRYTMRSPRTFWPKPGRLCNLPNRRVLGWATTDVPAMSSVMYQQFQWQSVWVPNTMYRYLRFFTIGNLAGYLVI